MRERVGIVVMAKAPVPGRVKTRLAGTLGADRAASLYAAMLADRFAQLARLPHVDLAVALFEAEPGARRPDFVPDGFEVLVQRGGGLGEGLAQAARHFTDRGQSVVLVDSDSPSLPLAYLARAVEGLREGRAEVVVGPSDDGGYYLIGLRTLWPALFTDMPWSTAQVVPETLARIATLGLTSEVLPVWWDVDEPSDLARLEAQLFETWWPQRTAQWLRDDARRGRAEPPPGGDELWAQPWTRLSSREVFATPWLRLREDQVRTPEGRHTTYSVVDCGHCVGVLPFVDPDTVLLVRQYRYVADRVTWEMPTGGVHPGEDALVAAGRELAEEAGVTAARLEPLCTYHTSKSVMDETAHLYQATGLTPTRAEGDPTEYIRVEPVSFSTALDWIASGQITDSMTIIALQQVALSRLESSRRRTPDGLETR